MSFRDKTRELLCRMMEKIGIPDENLDDANSLADGVLEVADQLKMYQEEGVDLRPEFLIFRESDHGELLNTTEVNHFFEIRPQAERHMRTFHDAVKHCAPLAHGVWAGFIKLRPDSLAYGVLRRRNSVISERVFSGQTHVERASRCPPPYLQVRQMERHLVEVSGPGDSLEIDFSITKPGVHEQSAYVARRRLLDCLTRNSWNSKKAHVRAVLEEAFDRALSHGHGFLVGVANCHPTSSFEFPILDERFLRNTHGLLFQNRMIPIQLKVAELVKWRMKGNPEEIAQVKDFLEAKGQFPENMEAFADRLSARYAETEAWSELISSMLMSDGMTLFDTRGSVLGFRLFVRSTETGPAGGGARLLAFDAMTQLVREGALAGAFYQSQDGRALFYEQ
ncbi:MAG: hypothetical protein HC902_14175 [Calothrix sp. SM1_5_4]|nr:hypothetical protein [Calothrix sp. SM1_5_4]